MNMIQHTINQHMLNQIRQHQEESRDDEPNEKLAMCYDDVRETKTSVYVKGQPLTHGEIVDRLNNPESDVSAFAALVFLMFVVLGSAATGACMMWVWLQP